MYVLIDWSIDWLIDWLIDYLFIYLFINGLEYVGWRDIVFFKYIATKALSRRSHFYSMFILFVYLICLSIYIFIYLCIYYLHICFFQLFIN